MFKPSSYFRSETGFSLVELMVVVVIIAIIAGIALPGYQSYVKKSRASTAAADLSSLSTSLENQFQRTLAYPPAAVTTTAGLQALLTSWRPAQGEFFAYSYTPKTGNKYELTATGTGVMSGCTLTLHSVDLPTVVGGAKCGNFKW